MSTVSIILLAGILTVYLIVRKSIAKLVTRIGQERGVSENRVDYIASVLVFVWSVFAAISAGMVAGLNFKDFGLFFGSAFALLGVALFAQWSILSNITASVIVFFFFPYRVGDYVKILDGDNGVEGKIKEITLFHVVLTNTQNEISTYPNAMVFQKAVNITQPPKASTEDVLEPKSVEGKES